MPSIDADTGLELLKDDVIEGTTAVFTTSSVIDPLGANIPSMATLTMSIYDCATESELVVGRDVLPEFNQDTSQITVTLRPQDNIIVDRRNSIEKHLLRFDFTYDGGSSKGVQAYVFRVVRVAGPSRRL